MPTRNGKTHRSRVSRKQEERAAQKFGGRRQPGSGAKWYARGDVRVEGLFLMEAKYTDSPRFSLTKQVVEKIANEALTSGQDHWVVEVWFRKQNRYVYAVDPQLLYVAMDKGLALPDHTYINRSTKSIPLTSFSQDTVFYELDGLRVAIVGESFMNEVNNTLQTRFLDVGTPLFYLLKDFNKQPRTRPLGVIGPSSLGQCKRKSWYRLMAVEPQNCIDPQLRMIFQMGHAIHDMIQKWISELFGPAFQAEVHAEIPEFYLSGSCDGVFQEGQLHVAAHVEEWLGLEAMGFAQQILDSIANGDRLGLEIKSCSTTPSSPKKEHMLQAITYGKALELTHMCIMYVNKRDGSITTFIRAVDNTTVWAQVTKELTKLKEYVDAGQTPPRELTRNCASCEYRYICKPPSNY